MTTATLIKKLNKEVEVLKREMREMKLMVVSAKDPEGEYKQSFIKKMLAREGSNGPFYRFTDKASFLKHVRFNAIKYTVAF